MSIFDTLLPEYVKEFSCIGAACEDTCCAGWGVIIDKETYKKYKKVKNPSMKYKIDTNIIRERSNTTKNNAAIFRMVEGKCSFLSEEGWCDIHSKLGEEYLCKTCAIYPRITNKVNEVIEQSLTVSCPEAARLVLLNKKGIGFEQGQKGVEIRDIVNNFNININKEITYWSDFFNEFRYVTIFILQSRNYTLEERLLILGLLFNEVEECVINNNLVDIPDILGRYIKCVEENLFKGEFSDIPKRLDIQLQLIKEIVFLRISAGISSARYLECSLAMMSGLKIDENITDEEIKEIYDFSYEKYYLPFIQQNSYMIENYLVNYVFRNCMPLDGSTPFESFSRMIMHYALIKIHLIGMANFHKGLTEDLVIKLIQSLSKTFEHNGKFLEMIMKLTKENNFMTLTYMSILIKN